MIGTSAPRRAYDAGRARSQAWWERSLYGHGYRRIRETDLDTHTLALCAQQVLCTAPLIVAMGAVLERITGRGAGYFMARFFGLHGASSDDIMRLFGRTANSITTFELIFAMVTAIVFTTSLAAVQQRAFEMLWGVDRVSGVRSYLRQLCWAVALGLYAAVLLVMGRFARAVGHELGRPAMIAVMAAQGVLTFAFYWWSQHWLLGGRVRWRALLPGAIGVGVGITILFRLTRVIMPGQIAWQVRAYGLIGGVFVLSVWLMILSVVIFGGVLLGVLIAERRVRREAVVADSGEAAADADGSEAIAGPPLLQPAAPLR